MINLTSDFLIHLYTTLRQLNGIWPNLTRKNYSSFSPTMFVFFGPIRQQHLLIIDSGVRYKALFVFCLFCLTRKTLISIHLCIGSQSTCNAARVSTPNPTQHCTSTRGWTKAALSVTRSSTTTGARKREEEAAPYRRGTRLKSWFSAKRIIIRYIVHAVILELTICIYIK